MLFVVASVYAVIAIPYSEAIRLWKGGPGIWDEKPRTAMPIWMDYLTRDRLSRTVIVTGESQGATMTEDLIGDGMKQVEMVIPLVFQYDTFPQEVNLFVVIEGVEDVMPVTTSWRTPDGRTFMIEEDRLVKGSYRFYASQNAPLTARLEGQAHVALFADPQNPERPLRGEYQFVLQAQTPVGVEISPKLVVGGQVDGLFGTDHRRRDLMIPILWGAPIGIAFGFLAAIGAQLSTFVLAGISTWFGGRLERVFQWVTQVNLVLPVLPILIMVGHFYNRSLWTMLGMIIALNVFSAAMLTYRAMFLQAKEAPYLEAAQSYGASNFRIVFRYLLPRLAPTLLPQFVLVIPSFVFLEATLAVLGLGDPVLPTWGKVMNDAYGQGALYTGNYYWILQPSILLMSMGVGFSLIGFALDRIFNPRLRTV